MSPIPNNLGFRNTTYINRKPNKCEGRRKIKTHTKQLEICKSKEHVRNPKHQGGLKSTKPNSSKSISPQNMEEIQESKRTPGKPKTC